MRYKVLLAALLCAGSLSITAQEKVKSEYQEFIEKGIALLKQDSLLQAEPFFLQAIKAEPTQKSNSILYNYLGQIQERTGRTQEALTSYGNAINLVPNSTEFLLNRAALYMRLENDDRALYDYTAVLEQKPDNQEALFFRAYLRTGKRMYKEARLDYEKLIELNPNNEKAILGLALLNDKDNRPQEAMEQITSLISFFPNKALYNEIRGGMHQQRKNYELAIKDFNKAIELEPENPDHLISRAECYLEMRKRKLAYADLQKAQSLGGDPVIIAQMLER